MRLPIRRLFLACLAVCSLSTFAAAADPPAKIPGLGPVGEVKKVVGGLQFTEGPAADGQGNLYFSDIPADRIYKVDAQGASSVFLEPSHHTNGLMINARGNLVACEMDGRIVEIDVKTKEVKSLADQYEGKRFNAPNDLVLDKAGGVYFTDPHFRAPMPLPQGKPAFYYRAADGKVARLADNLAAPNGAILSPDEKTLYVIPSLQKQMFAYPVTAPGKLGEPRVFCELKQKDPAGNGGGDGLTVDVKGNLYITSALGLQVYNPAGELLGIIEFPEQPANATFGGPGNKTLYVTARTSLYSVEMEVAGHVFPAK
ncbi:MAG: SMP-30/gluconolactonase/LRE family protein [Pirellulales bacterium]